MVETVKKKETVSKRINTRLDTEQYAKVLRACKKHECTVADWIRHVLDKAKV